MQWIRRNAPVVALLLALVSPIGMGLMTWGAVSARVSNAEAHVNDFIASHPVDQQQIGQLNGRMQSVEAGQLRIEKSLLNISDHLFTLSSCCSSR